MNSLKVNNSQPEPGDSFSSLPSESQMGDADVIKDEAKLCSARYKLLIRPRTHLKTFVSKGRRSEREG